MPLKTRNTGPDREDRHFKTPFRLQSRDSIDEPWRTEHWIHCPVCWAVSADFSKSGRPKYQGGRVVVSIRGKKPAVVACSCWLGRRWKEAVSSQVEVLRLDQLEPGSYEVLTPRPTPSDCYRVVDAQGNIARFAPAEEPDALRPAWQGRAPALPEPPEEDESDLFS